MSIKALQDYTFVAKYARYNPDKKRRETYRESVDRVRAMMHEKYAHCDEETHKLIDWAYDMQVKKKVMGSQRALQFGGDPIFAHNARIYNCHKFSTKFVTSEGVKTFSDFSNGDVITVLTPYGNWKTATVKSYGKQRLNKITFKRGSNSVITEYATANHRWLLHDGSETTELKVGDYVINGPNIFSDFDFDNATLEEKLYWCYGFVYGDGTVVGNKYSMVRLCGEDVKYEKRFTDLGFKTSSSLSIDGDVIVYTGKYKKTSPDPSVDNPQLIRAFVHGYLSADGSKNRSSSSDRQFLTIQSSDVDHIEFIRKCFPVAGVFITKERDLTGQITNYGTRPYTVMFNLIDHYSKTTSQKIKVVSIEEDTEETVWCLEVEDDKSFMLASGIPTGNCTATYIDRIRSFQEIMYLLLCGCGVGFSVQRQHVETLPDLLSEKTGTVKYTIPDTIEGWSDAIGILISSYFEHDGEFQEYRGKEIKFDFSKIRPKGSRISNGGKAPGPEPLKKALNNIRKVLDDAIVKSNRLDSIDAYDIIMHASDAVISGGVRRSATLCLFSPDDEKMAKAKTGNWFTENPQRGRSNNSALLLRDSTSEEDFHKLMISVKEFGEPGFVWSDHVDLIPNPCVTIDTKILTTDGWREIGTLLGDSHVEIHQDARVLGFINQEGEEDWTVDMSIANETVVNSATHVRKTGVNQQVYELELSCGRSVKATGNHHFATPDGMVELKDLSTEDEILIPISTVYQTNKHSNNFNLGYIAGLVFGDGCFPNENTVRIDLWGDHASEMENIESIVKSLAGAVSTEDRTYNQNENPTFRTNSGHIYGSKEKHSLSSTLLGSVFKRNGIPLIKDNISFIHSKSKDFKAGFISGLFYADGHTEYNENSKSLSLRITSVSIHILKDIQLIMQELGIFSRINLARPAGSSLLPDSNREYVEYKTQDCYRLIVGGIENCYNCLTVLKLNEYHSFKIANIRNNRTGTKKNTFTSRVKNITYIGNEDVYCLGENIRRTMIVEGITSRRCVEISLRPIDDETGLTGVQGCNLSTINISKVKTLDDFIEFSKAASILGTLQAGFTDFPYLGETSEKIFRKEALLGVSGTGWMDSPDICLNPENQQKAALAVKEMNKYMAAKLGINPAARTTCVKPEGSVSCVLGTASGIHPHHAKRYIRRVQANKMESIYQHFKKTNPRACEESVWSANKTDDVIAFCVEVADGSKTKNQITAIDLLTVVKSTQQNWVMFGTNKELCTAPWLVHNVSNTINVKPEEWGNVEKFIYNNKEFFCGVSLLPVTGDKDYPQAPFTTVYLPSEMISYYGDGVMFASGLIEVALELWEDNLWAACDSLLGLGSPPKGKAKTEWVKRCVKFSNKYFNGNMKKLTYCMKDVYNYKLWTELKQEYKEVDYTDVHEEYDNTELEQVLACSGGACELV